MITREFTEQFEITPEELANEFCEMDGSQQAIFFNSIYELSKLWKRSFPFQMQAILDSEVLNPNGEWIMKTIGNYSKAI